MFWCPATKKRCDQPCQGSNCLRLTPRVLRAVNSRECPKCGFSADGTRVKARMVYVCGGCGARFWAPAVVIEVAADVVDERARPFKPPDRHHLARKAKAHWKKRRGG